MQSDEPFDFNKAFCRNTKALRERLGVTQERMATSLGVSLEAYKKYENRTPLPHRLVPRFCLICSIPIDDLFAVQGRSFKTKAVVQIRDSSKSSK